jgi:endonuclease-3
MSSTNKASKIISVLKKHYPPVFFDRDTNPFYTLISCLMSLRTKDEVTYPKAENLFRKADTPAEMIKLGSSQIEKIIYPVGFYRVKAKRIVEISKTLINEYSGRVPDSMDELLKLKGVGRKTANIVITHAFRKPGIAVDTHVHRISNRLGLVKTKKTELALMKVLPKKDWIIFNELLVKHGKTICKPISPLCSKCPVFAYCKRIDVTYRR